MATTATVVTEYVDAINAKDLDALIELFAPDAVLDHVIGTFTGRDEIRGLYRDVVFAGEAVLTIHDESIVDGGAVTGIVDATSPLDPGAGSLRATDVFHLDGDGRVSLLAITYE